MTDNEDTEEHIHGYGRSAPWSQFVEGKIFLKGNWRDGGDDRICSSLHLRKYNQGEYLQLFHLSGRWVEHNHSRVLVGQSLSSISWWQLPLTALLYSYSQNFPDFFYFDASPYSTVYILHTEFVSSTDEPRSVIKVAGKWCWAWL